MRKVYKSKSIRIFMIDKKNMIEAIKKRCFYFWQNEIPIHISLNTEKWANGIIKEFLSDGFILNEFKEGEIPIFYIEILPNGIEPYKKEGEK